MSESGKVGDMNKSLLNFLVKKPLIWILVKARMERIYAEALANRVEAFVERELEEYLKENGLK